MPVKTTLKPYCYLKPLDSNGRSIYLHDGETTRLSHEGRIVLPIEDPELIHIRVKPDVAAKTLSTIYVSNYKGCWINGCIALCWYKYILNHGHIVRLQPDGYEFEVNFFPPPQEKVADLLFLKIPKSLTEIPKKIVDELVSEAKLEYFEEKLKIKAEETKQSSEPKIVSSERRIERKAPKKKTKKKCGKSRKPLKPLKVDASAKSLEKHVRFKTRPKLAQTAQAEEQALETSDYLASTSAQTTDEGYKLERSTSLFRKVFFSAEASKTRLYKRHVDKSVRFIPETESDKSVLILQPDVDSEEDIETSKSGIFEMVLELYDRMREEEREYAMDKNFVMYLLDRILRKVYSLKKNDLKFVHDLLDEVVEDAVTMKERQLAFAKRVVDDIVERAFTARRKTIEGGFFERLLGDIFKRIREPESKPKLSREKVVVVESPSSSDEESERENEEKTPVVKVVYEYD